MRTSVKAAMCAAAALLVAFPFSVKAQEGTLAERARSVPQSDAQVKLSYAPLVKRTTPAVVNVYAQRVVRSQQRRVFSDPAFDQFFGGFFGAPRERVQNSLGSGVIVRADGYVITNAHVVSGAQELRVVLTDRREFDAELVLADPRTDLALLRIRTGDESLPTLAFDRSGDTEVGDLVLAIGNPLGVGQTVTAGIISALGRSEVGVSDYSFFIQTDASVNPGNSGGALVDMEGELIGVNTAIFSRSGGSDGIGFAIPVDLVVRFVEDAISQGRVVRSWFGAKGQTVTNDIANSLGLERPQGFVIADVFTGGPADKAGLRKGDVVLRLDDVEVNDEAALRFRLATRKIGERARLQIWRANKVQTLSLNVEAPPNRPTPDRRLLQGSHPLAGAEIANLSPAFNDENGIDPFLSGVIVMSVRRSSPADYYGFRAGDLIEELQGEAISSAALLDRRSSEAAATREWSVTLQRGGRNFQRVIRF
jgi:Do/DeqQ family serine protease